MWLLKRRYSQATELEISAGAECPTQGYVRSAALACVVLQLLWHLLLRHQLHHLTYQDSVYLHG